MTMNTMTRFSEFFESKLNKLITSPTGPARRAFLALALALTVGGAGAQGTRAIGNDVKATGQHVVENVVIPVDGTAYDAGTKLKEKVNALSLSFEGVKTYARLYFAKNSAGDMVDDASVAQFAGSSLTNWQDFKANGYVYYGTGFPIDNLLNDIKVTATSGVSVALVIALNPTDVGYSLLAGKKWRLAYEVRGHFANQEWAAPPDDKKDSNPLYDDRISFVGDNYYYDPGYDGQTLVNDAFNLKGGTGERAVTFENTDTPKKWEIVTHDGADWLRFPDGGLFPYIYTNKQYTGPYTEYKIIELSDDYLQLSYTENGYTWSFIFTPAIDSPSAYFDPSSDRNILKDGATTIEFPDGTTQEDIAGGKKFHIPNIGGGQWDSQVRYKFTGVTFTDGKRYDYYVKFKSNRSYFGPTIKIENGPGFGGYRIPVEAGKEYEIYRTNVPNAGNHNAVDFLFSCGGNPTGELDIEITDMIIQEHVDDVTDASNIWNSATKNPTFYVAGGTAPTLTSTADGVYSFGIPTHTEGDWWNFQFMFSNTGLNIATDKSYDFSCVLRADRADIPVTVKIQKSDDSGADYLFEKRVVIPVANQDYLFQISDLDVTKGTNISTSGITDFKLLFGSGDIGDGAVLKISNITLKEHATTDLDAIVKDPQYDAKVVLNNFLSIPASSSWTRTHVFSASENSVTIDLSTDAQLSSSMKTTNFQYMRWNLKDNNGNSILGQDGYAVNVDGFTYEDNAAIKNEHGVYWHSATASTVSNLKINVTAPAGVSLAGYTLYGYLGSAEGVVDGSGKLITEPEYTSMFVFPFVDKSFIKDDSNLKTDKVPIVKYKTVLYDADNRKLTPSLFANWREVVADIQSNYTEFPKTGYARWYVEEEDGTLVDMEDFSVDVVGYVNRGQYGFYYLFDNEKDSGKFPQTGADNTSYDPTIILPEILPSGKNVKEGKNYKNIKVVCVVTSDRSDDSRTDLSLPLVKEYKNVLAKYIFRPYTLYDYQHQPFVHSTGVSMRDYESVGKQVAATHQGTETQYVWNYTTGESDVSDNSDIRQSVHTVIYDYYVKEGETTVLRLPFAIDYTKNTEPLGYFRWYDYTTDMKASSEVQTSGSDKCVLVDTPRGFIALRPDSEQDAGHDRIGVTFTGTATTTYPQYIACDVSRYTDGIEYTTGKYLVHEPTLSMRYIFRINSASTVADAISTKMGDNWDTSGTNVRPKTDKLTDPDAVFDLLENNGLVVVSLDGTDGKFNGEFALRMDMAKSANVSVDDEMKKVFSNYFLTSDSYANALRWDIYYSEKNAAGDTEWYVKPMNMAKETFIGFDNYSDGWYHTMPPKYQARKGWRIGTYSLDDFMNETGYVYTKLSDGTDAVGPTSKADAATKTYHVVGVLSNGTIERPVAHYELQFIDAKPVLYSELNNYPGRQDEALREKLPLGTTLTFDDLFSDVVTKQTEKPTTAEANYAMMPLAWDDAQYGFCYPQLYAYNGTSYRINHKDNWAGFGLSPLHGDYILLKSMYVKNVSMPGDLSNSTYYTNWYRDNKKDDYSQSGKYINVAKDAIDNPFYDITYKKTNGTSYGTFLYVDAADEPRTIAKLNFDAAGLCSNSELYYTAYLADLTSPRQTAPQVMFHVYAFEDNDKSKDRVLVMSFLAGDMSTLISEYSTYELSQAPNTYPTINPYDVIQKDLGHWYQIYGHVTLPKDKLPSVPASEKIHFEVVIDNYATSTCGADYAIDEISFYTSAANLFVEQNTSGVCDPDGKMEARFYIGAENLQNVLSKDNTEKTIYYRIIDASTGKPLQNVKYSTTELSGGKYVTTNNNLDYGVVKLITNYTSDQVVKNSERTISNPVGFYKDDNGEVKFCIAWRNDYPFNGNTEYYMSLLDHGFDPATADASHWGGPGKGCSIYSASFIARKVHITLLDGEKPIGEKVANCDGWWRVSLTAATSLPQGTGFNAGSDYVNVTNMHYDYYVGSLSELNSIPNLVEALDNYRDLMVSKGFDEEGLDPDYKSENETYYRALETAVANGTLLLNYSPKFEYEFVSEGVYHFVAIPYERFINLSGTTPETYRNQKSSENAAICQPMPFDVSYTSSQPSLELGFEDVDYPETDTYRTIRIGKEQLENLQDKGFILHVPVRNYTTPVKDSDGNITKLSKTGTLVLTGFTLFGTTDPTIEKSNSPSADGATTKDDYVTASTPTLATFDHSEIDPSHLYVALNFHGDGVTKLDFKEGYEYKAMLLYHDKNSEITCESALPVLLKIVPEYVTWEGETVNINWNNDANWSRSKKEELYKTADQYTNNADAGLGTTQPKTYIPMKFTYVTMPTDNRAPKLISLSKDANSDIYTNISEGIDAASTNVQYDIMVRYTEKECLDRTAHDVASTANIYDCEKFYGNVCNEIYFKPEAELVNQQYLTYNKAWVEKELAAAKWSLMATPLQDTYSGDMYVPSATGKQATEAFKDISFNTTDYSRTLYPIYQRSWGEDFDSNVYVATNDTYRSDFTANLPFTAVTTDVAEWSHTFNDVNVAYTDRTGFAIRAHKEGTGTARIRLPKADTSYSYYSWDGTETAPQTGTASATLTKTNANKFVTDGTTDGAKTIDVGSLQKVGDYVLVGNPYMASLKMSEFFKGNTGITTMSYQTYSDGAVTTAASTGVIRPLQAFFVQVPSDVTSLNFTKAMMIDGNHETDGDGNDGGGVRRYMSISAVNEHGSSAANVRIDTQASDGFVVNEDVETLFDSNLAEVPMVYTVAGQQAVSIDVRPAFELLPFGVVCAANNEPVSVTFDEAELLGAPLYVVDGATGEATPVNSGDAYEVQPNDYGRYFLSTRGDLTAIERTEVVNGIVISVRGRQVTVHAPSALESVRAITTNGIAAYSTTVGTTDTSFTLNANGIYIIEAQTADTTKTVKVVVK